MKKAALFLAAIATFAAQYEPVQRTKDATGTVTQNVDFTGTTKVNGTDIGAFNFTTPAQGDVLYYNGTNWVALGAGTSGEFLKTNGTGANPAWATPTGAGDVVGPGSSVDNQVARFDSTTGKIIQTSAVTIDDSGNLGSVGNISLSGTVDGIDVSQLDADALKDTTYDAQTVLVAVTDDTPVATTIADSQFVGRPAGGNVGAMTKAQALTVLNVADGAQVNWTTVTQGIAEAGTSTTEYSWTPERVKQAIVALAPATTGVYRNLWIGAGAFIPNETNGAEALTSETGSNAVMYDHLNYDASTIESAWANFVLPDEWNYGTVKAKVYWDCLATGANDVVWSVGLEAVGNHDVIDHTISTAQTVTDTVLSVGDVHISDATPAITVDGSPAIGDLIFIQLKRVANDAGDTLAVDAKFLGVMLQYYESTTEPAVW